MKTIFASIALFVAGTFAQLTINTPSNVVECEPTLITWSGGTGPYTVSVVPGATPNGASLESFNATSATSMTWTCNIQTGTSIGLNVRDSTGTVAQSAAFTVAAGTSTSCLNSTSVAPGPTGASSSGAASTAGATTTGPSASAATTASGSAATTSSASSGTSGASANVAEFGVAGVVGAAVAALFL